MAAHSSVLAWRIPGTGEPGRLQSMGLQRVRHNRVTNAMQRNATQNMSTSFGLFAQSPQFNFFEDFSGSQLLPTVSESLKSGKSRRSIKLTHRMN